MKIRSIFRSRAARKRGKLFMEFLNSFDPPIRIIDLGGTVSMWERWGLCDDSRLKVHLANNFSMDTNSQDSIPSTNNISKITVDVATLKPEDYRQYDLIFSNSMLEHLADFEQQRSVAQAIVQSGRPYFVQVPNKYSLIDPHFAHPLAPFYAAWPRFCQLRALRFSGLNGGRRAQSLAHAERRLRFYNPLSRRDIDILFSDDRKNVMIERALGMPMSIVVFSRQDDRAACAVG